MSRNLSLWAQSRSGKVSLTQPQAILSGRITGRLYITSTSQTRAALPSRKRRTQWCTKLGTIIFNTSFDLLRQKLQCVMEDVLMLYQSERSLCGNAEANECTPFPTSGAPRRQRSALWPIWFALDLGQILLEQPWFGLGESPVFLEEAKATPKTKSV